VQKDDNNATNDKDEINNSINFDNNITTVEKALEYLNYLRNKAGMISLNINEYFK
jgi:hypothetical protein